MERNKVSRILKDGRKPYYSSIVFPTIPLTGDDVYIITEYGDRLDKISYEFYQDSTFWWVLADLNNIPNDSLFPEVGIQLRIPQSLDVYLEEFRKINENR